MPNASDSPTNAGNIHGAAGLKIISTPTTSAAASTPRLTTFWPGYVNGRVGISS